MSESAVGSLQCTVLDCRDPQVLARFYATVLGGTVNRPDRRWATNADWATLHLPGPGGQVLCFQRVADHRPPVWGDASRPQQLHLDIGVADLDAAEAALVEAGGTLLDKGTDNRPWRIYADPAGHHLCLVHEPQRPTVPGLD